MLSCYLQKRVYFFPPSPSLSLSLSVCVILQPNCITMEEYEKFCKKYLARIQGEFMENGMSPVVQCRNVSVIRFNGVPVLSPLLTLEKKKELQQDRQKALELERSRQSSKQRLLLTRVEEIVANVQMKQMSSQSDLDQSEKENIRLDLESEALNGSATEPPSVLPNSAAFGEHLEPKQIPDAKPVDPQGQADRTPFEGTEQLILPNPMETSSSPLEKRIGSEDPFPSLPSTPPSNEIAKKESTDPGLGAGEGPDPYVMSLQNLLKKSREYIQREQTRRSLRSSSKRNGSGSHPDKENSAVKTSEKERGKLTGRNTPTPEKSGLIKPSAPQPSSVSKNHASGVTSPSFSKVDIPMRSGTPPVLDSDSDEEFKHSSLFGKDSILRSFTGSYSKLPSPEPSLSPKMHRRRPRPSSVGHIVITNPVNAYELSPKAKGRAADLIVREAGGRPTASDAVPNLPADLACPREAQAFDKSSSDTFNELVVGKHNEVCPLPANRQEGGSFLAYPIAEGESMLENGAASSGCLANLSSPELRDVSGALLTQNPAKTETPPDNVKGSVADKVKGSMVTELNKSYDVQRPSPLLMMQMQSKPPLDTPEVTLKNEQVLENGLEKVKRRLELEVDAVQKENTPWALSAEADAPERRWPHDQRYPGRAGLEAKNETPARCLREEETLRQKMRALAELRQKLEEQHAQQLSLLIAEQEREQERLQKEIEEQAWRLKEEKTATESGIPPINIGSSVALEWRKITDTNLLESVLNRVEAAHNTNLESEGLVNAGSPFYLWEQPASGKPVVASRSISRSKMRWSQVYSPAMKRKFNKVSALAKGFLTRRLLQTEKLKHLRQTVHDTMEFIKNFQSEALSKRGNLPTQDANLQERVVAQLQAALYDIHDIFFKMEASERMSILRQDREIRKEKMLRQLDKAKSPRDRVTLSTATQKSLDRKRAAEMGILNKKTIGKQKIFENRVLQPNQGQNAPIQRLLSRQGTSKASVKGAEQNRKKPSDHRVPSKAFSGVSVGRIPRKKPNVATT
ncbi:centriolar coiled-coil protein of 110 kDa isoform X2 [Ahaetulla prasina]|uniref:centriolar coiled-coil protein of 110 kDa isoform X2 n=1 Tax=Ahaetulla prasina TaxID=499056 RepID=UPI00264779C1|nr:centriolar coiled-coil protein of 110 kDa isoform X2 [Ahaetulla prasina]